MRRPQSTLFSVCSIALAASAVMTPDPSPTFAASTDRGASHNWHVLTHPRFAAGCDQRLQRPTVPLWRFGYGDQGPPPPITLAIWRKFLVFVATYERFGADIPVSFDEWIVVNGVTDMPEQVWFMWLWWNRPRQHAVD